MCIVFAPRAVALLAFVSCGFRAPCVRCSRYAALLQVDTLVDPGHVLSEERGYALIDLCGGKTVYIAFLGHLVTHQCAHGAASSRVEGRLLVEVGLAGGM